MDSPTPSPGAAKILVIDDNPIIQRTMYFALRDKGHRVLMCGDISTALKLVREERPDVILLDLNFPPDAALGGSALRDGFWALDWLHRMDEATGTPVIVVSSDPAEKSKAPALTRGAAAYFEKPVNQKELAATVAELLARKGPGTPPAPGA
jgi:CheY-like chemotaxis protein